MGLWNYLGQFRGLTCFNCDRKFLSGIIRFERGHKVGVVCHACASSGGTTEIDFDDRSPEKTPPQSNGPIG
jgi:hypothetical protein